MTKEQRKRLNKVDYNILEEWVSLWKNRRMWTFGMTENQCLNSVDPRDPEFQALVIKRRVQHAAGINTTKEK